MARTVPFLLLASTLAAQHCGLPGRQGIAGGSDAGRLVPGDGWSLVWEADGAAVGEVGRVGAGFYAHWLFAAPDGEGFLVIGQPLLTSYGRAQASPGLLCYYAGPQDLRLALPYDAVAAEDERLQRGSCGFEQGCYTFLQLAAPPALEEDGARVRIELPGSQRVVRFDLALGLLLDERGEELLCALLRSPYEAPSGAVHGAIVELGDPEPGVREAARTRLEAEGAAVWPDLLRWLHDDPDPEVAFRLEELLAPCCAFPRELAALPFDLDGLARLATFPDAALARAAVERLIALTPFDGRFEPAHWRGLLERERDALVWDPDYQAYRWRDLE